MNLKFYYIYRDFTNYKKHNEIIFSNPNNKPVEEVQAFIKDHLLDGQWFYSSEWKVPDLHFEGWDAETDHFLHEFGSLTETTEPADARVTIEEFMAIIKAAKTHFWVTEVFKMMTPLRP